MTPLKILKWSVSQIKGTGLRLAARLSSEVKVWAPSSGFAVLSLASGLHGSGGREQGMIASNCLEPGTPRQAGDAPDGVVLAFPMFGRTRLERLRCNFHQLGSCTTPGASIRRSTTGKMSG